jgi:hypothetical protein
MRKSLSLICITLIFSRGYAQHGDTASEFTFFLSDPNIENYFVYYPFYNGVQMIKVDMLAYEGARIRFLDAMQPISSFRYSTVESNDYVLRNEMGIIIRQYCNNLFRYEDSSFIHPSALKSKAVRYHVSDTAFDYYGKGYFWYHDKVPQYDKYSFKVIDPSTGKFGIIDTLGNFQIVALYDEIIYAKSNYYILREGKWGLIDQGFKMIISPKYSRLESLDPANLACYEKCGIVDNNGAVIVGFMYDEIAPVRKHVPGNTRFYRFTVNKRIGLLDADFKVMVPAVFNSFGVYENGRFYASDTNNIYMILNPDCTPLSENEFTAAPELLRSGNYRIYKSDGSGGRHKQGIIDSAGNVLIPARYEYIEDIVVGKAIAYLHSKYGVVKVGGRELTGFKYDKIVLFRDGMGKLYLDGKWAYMDSKGHLLTDLKFDEAEDFHRGYARVQIGQQWGLIDSSGKQPIPCEYVNIQTPRDGFVMAVTGYSYNFRYGFINLKNEIQIPFLYDNIREAGSRRAWVTSGGKHALANLDTKTVGPFLYDEAYEFRNGLALVKANGKYGLVNHIGQVVVPVKYDHVQHNWYALIPVCLDGAWGCVNRLGKIVIPLIYTKAEYTRDGLIKLEMYNKIHYINEKGVKIR